MPQVSMTPGNYLPGIIKFTNILKCSHIDNGVLQLNDLARLDLYTPLGITRQIDLINGIFPLWEDSYLEMLETDSSEHCVTILGETSQIFSDEFYETVTHYFRNQIFITRERNIAFNFKTAKIGADFLRVILSDFADAQLIKDIRVRVAADILIEITTRKKTIFLSRSCVKIYFLDQIPTDKEILDSLRYFGYTLTKSDLDGWEFNIPFHRVDIFEEQDLIEDILLFQMDKFTTVKSIHSSQIECSNERMRRRMDALRDDLVSFGFREIKTPLLRKEGKSYLVRSSILPSILEYEKGIQHLPRPHQIFEIGSVIEADRLLNRLIFSRIEVETDFNTFFSIICHILKPISSIPVTLKPFESSKYASGKGFILEWNTLSIGEFGVIEQKIQSQYRIKNVILVAEINLSIFATKSYEP